MFNYCGEITQKECKDEIKPEKKEISDLVDSLWESVQAWKKAESTWTPVRQIVCGINLSIGLLSNHIESIEACIETHGSNKEFPSLVLDSLSESKQTVEKLYNLLNTFVTLSIVDTVSRRRVTLQDKKNTIKKLSTELKKEEISDKVRSYINETLTKLQKEIEDENK